MEHPSANTCVGSRPHLGIKYYLNSIIVLARKLPELYGILLQRISIDPNNLSYTYKEYIK